jgi:hypothetical protein
MENRNQISVIEFYVWSKTNGNTTNRVYMTIGDGQLINLGQCDNISFRVLARVEVNKSKLKELEFIAKRG